MEQYIDVCVREVEDYFKFNYAFATTITIRPVDLKSRNYIEIYAKADKETFYFVFPLRIEVDLNKAYYKHNDGKPKSVLTDFEL